MIPVGPCSLGYSMSLCLHLVRYNVLKAAPRAGQRHFWPWAVLCPFAGLDPQSPSSMEELKAPAPDLELPLFLFQVYPHPHGLKPNSSSSAGAHAASPCSSHILGWKAEGFPHRSRLRGGLFSSSTAHVQAYPLSLLQCWMLDGAVGEAGTGDLTPYGCEGSRGCAHPRRDPLPFPSSSVPLPVLGAAEFPRASLRAISEEQQPRAWHFLSHFSPASREQIPKEAKPHLHRLGGAGRPGEGWDWGPGSSCCPMDSRVQLTVGSAFPE